MHSGASRCGSVFQIPYFDVTRNTVDSHEQLCNNSAMKLDDAAAHLEALGNPTRLKIYRTLFRAGAAGLSVGRLQDKLKIAPSTLSDRKSVV